MSEATGTCPTCNAVVGADDQFCGDCGTAVVRSGTCPTCDAGVGAEDQFCGECGTSIVRCLDCGTIAEADALFCESCGHALGKDAPTAMSEPIASGSATASPASSGNRLALIAAVLALVLLAAIAGVVLLSSRDDDNADAKSKPAAAQGKAKDKKRELPTEDLDGGPNPGTIPAELESIEGLVSVGGGTTSADDESWRVFVTEDSADSVCDAVDAEWIQALEDKGFSSDSDRAGELEQNLDDTVDGCVRSSGYTVHGEGEDTVARVDVVVREFDADDPLIEGEFVERALVPDDVPAFDGPYTEVQLLTTGALPGAGDDAAMTEEDVVTEIADILTQSKRGREHSINRRYTKARSNREAVLARVEKLQGRTELLGTVLEQLHESISHSLASATAHQRCRECATPEDGKATIAKRQFVLLFNPYARRYLGQTYVDTEL